MITLLKKNREIFLDYQKKTNTNMLLCIFGLVPDKETIKELTGGRQKMIVYFPYERMSRCEVNIIANEDAPSYAIAGITMVADKMVYFTAERIRAGKKMIVEQKNYDHLYHNQPIKVFETEEDFVRFLCASEDGFCGKEVSPYVLYRMFNTHVVSALNDQQTQNNSPMKASIIEGILEINPASSLANQMVV